MADTTGAAPAAAPAAPAKPAPLGKASDLIGTPAMDPPAAKVEPTAPAAETPDELTAKRLARIASTNAAERAKVKAERDKFQADQKATIEAAAKWQALEDAKGKGDQLAVLRQLWKDDEITEGLYQKLTDHIYNSNSAETLTRADVVALAAEQAKKLRADEKALEEEERKKTEAAKSSTMAERQVAYLGDIQSEWGKVAANYPWIGFKPVTGAEIIAHIDECWKKDKTVPSPEEIFQHFEADRKSGAPVGGNSEQAPQKTVTGAWKSDAPPTGARPMSLKESLELAKREASGSK